MALLTLQTASDMHFICFDPHFTTRLQVNKKVTLKLFDILFFKCRNIHVMIFIRTCANTTDSLANGSFYL